MKFKIDNKTGVIIIPEIRIIQEGDLPNFVPFVYTNDTKNISK